MEFSHDYDEIIQNVKILITVALWEISYRTFSPWKSLCLKGSQATMATEKNILNELISSSKILLTMSLTT